MLVLDGVDFYVRWAERFFCLSRGGLGVVVLLNGAPICSWGFGASAKRLGEGRVSIGMRSGASVDVTLYEKRFYCKPKPQTRENWLSSFRHIGLRRVVGFLSLRQLRWRGRIRDSPLCANFVGVSCSQM